MVQATESPFDIYASGHLICVSFPVAQLSATKSLHPGMYALALLKFSAALAGKVSASRIATAYRVMAICPVDPSASYNKLAQPQAGKALEAEMWISNAIIGLILLALAVAGAWRWYDNHVRAQSKNQMMETAAGDVRETAECHLEAFKLRPGLTETDLAVQHEDTSSFQAAPRQCPMPGAYGTLVTSSIRFAGGRIELGSCS
jgi:hypothetical protein